MHIKLSTDFISKTYPFYALKTFFTNYENDIKIAVLLIVYVLLQLTVNRLISVHNSDYTAQILFRGAALNLHFWCT